MLRRDILVLEAIGLFVRQVDDALDTRRDEDLTGTTAKDISLGTRAKNIIQSLDQCRRIYLQKFQNLGNNTLWLLDERHQDVFCIYLIVSVPLDDLSGALSGLLGTLGKTIKS